LKGRKNHEREDIDTRKEEEEEERRSNKQSALNLVDESDLSDAFDRMVMLSVENVCNEHCSLQSETMKAVEASGGKSLPKKQGTKDETVDLRNPLMMC